MDDEVNLLTGPFEYLRYRRGRCPHLPGYFSYCTPVLLSQPDGNHGPNTADLLAPAVQS